MLRPHYGDLHRTKVLELRPDSFAHLLKYMGAEFSAEPERLPKTLDSLHAGHQGQDDSEGQDDSDPASMLQLMLQLIREVFLVMVVIIHIILACLRSLFNKVLHFVV